VHPPAPDGPEASLLGDAAPPGVKKLLQQLIIGVLLLFAVGGMIAWLYGEWLIALGNGFVDQVGGPGLFAIFYFLDIIWLPIPQDAFSGLALVGGMPFVEVTAWCSAGSVLGGITAFSLARVVGRSDRFQRWLARKGGDAHAVVRRWGVLGVAVGALTPIPYSLTCWAGGALGMDVRPFLLVSLLRIPRVAIYLWLIDLGIVRIIE
jgi:membrane protein YqaA with SNARE-associated domain